MKTVKLPIKYTITDKVFTTDLKQVTMTGINYQPAEKWKKVEYYYTGRYGSVSEEELFKTKKEAVKYVIEEKRKTIERYQEWIKDHERDIENLKKL